MPSRIFCLAVCFLCAAGGAFAAAPTAPDPARVRELAAMLPQQPRGVGPVIGDRRAWQAVAAAPQYAGVVARAEKLLRQPIPPLTDELYLDYSRTGIRSRAEAVMRQRQARLRDLVTAECIENRGRFLKAIEAIIADQCGEKAWQLPAHDSSLLNFHGKLVDIDLWSSRMSWSLATAAYWLGDRLSPATRKLVADELERRTFAPYVSAITSGKPKMWWPTGTNNWNAVCTAGVIGAALAQIESPGRRAFFLAAAEKNIRHYLDGIGPDGYCSEGLDYWSYGFGHYVLLAETVSQATGGKLDLFRLPKVEPLARFAVRMEILPGVYPALTDCTPGTQPDAALLAFVSRRWDLGLAEVERKHLLLAGKFWDVSDDLFTLGVFGFANSASRTPPAAAEKSYALRDWFEAGILIARPRTDRLDGLGVCLAGGNNAKSHNHNDLGSFVVALAGGTPLVDPGAEVYTSRTFSRRRYESDVINSFGHSVPRVAGTLQREGRQAEAKILARRFTPQSDTLALDLTSAYPVPELTRLVRTFVFSREGSGSLRVSDEVELRSPQAFETALVTFSKWRAVGPASLEIGEGAQAVRVDLDAGGRGFRIEPVEIHENLRAKRIPTRLGIALAEPVTHATITVTIRPR
jgi:hypothetical protein